MPNVEPSQRTFISFAGFVPQEKDLEDLRVVVKRVTDRRHSSFDEFSIGRDCAEILRYCGRAYYPYHNRKYIKDALVEISNDEIPNSIRHKYLRLLAQTIGEPGISLDAAKMEAKDSESYICGEAFRACAHRRADQNINAGWVEV